LIRYHASAAEARPHHGAARQGDIRRSLANVDKARRLLGYEPTHRVSDGLAEALQWYAARAADLEAPVSR
jgi:UDP-N-acetylglucosamine 4-epimerase